MSELADLIRSGPGRGLEFVTLAELQKRTGYPASKITMFALSEMLCNSLDTDATEIQLEAESADGFHRLTIRDNGSKRISSEDLRLILDFTNKASSKRGFLRVSRGYLGNALKCIFGYSYALAEAAGVTPPEIIVTSHGSEYRVNLHPDRVSEVIKSDIRVSETGNDRFNVFIVSFPEAVVQVSREEMLDLIQATSMVNLNRRITFNLWGAEGSLGSGDGGGQLRRETSILWYTPKEFGALFHDYLRARPDTPLRDFISLFRGFTAKDRIGEILQDLNSSRNHDSHRADVQFFPATPISLLHEADVAGLFHTMKGRAKPISKRSIPQVLGTVGQEAFERCRERNQWERLRYIQIMDEENDEGSRSFPYVIELAVFDRGKGDAQGLKVFQCVNFMASMEDIFSKLFDIKYRLGLVGITPEMPVTVLAHLVCPVLKWLNYGKSGFY